MGRPRRGGAVVTAVYEDPTGRLNSSGCADPTAWRATSRTSAEEEAVDRMLGLRRIIYALAKHDGVWVEVRMQDKRTGARLG